MIILGIILMIAGIASYLWASSMQNSFEYKWYEMWGSSDYEYVDVILYIGIFAVVIGLIFLIVGIAKKYTQTDKSNYTGSGNLNADIRNNAANYSILNHITCEQCGALIDKNVSFCQNCGSKNNAGFSKNKFCSNCGTQVKENENFCGNCGCKF